MPTTSERRPISFVEPLQGVGRAKLRPSGRREAVEGQEVLLGCLEQLGDLGQRASEALEHLAEPGPGLIEALGVAAYRRIEASGAR